MRKREGLSLREQAALALALALLDAEPQVSRDVYRQMPHKVELLDGVVVLSDFDERGMENGERIAIREEWRKHE